MQPKLHFLSLLIITPLLSLAFPLSLAGTSLGFSAAMAQAPTTQNRKAEADRLFQTGVQQFRHSQFQQARQTYQQVLAIRQRLGDKAGMAQTLNNIGEVYNKLSQYPKALSVLQQALAIRQAVGARAGIGETLTRIGDVEGNLSQYPKALSVLQQALAIRQQVGDRFGEGETLNLIGAVYGELSQYSKALETLQQALTIRQQIGDRFGEGETLDNIGVIYRRLSQYSKALETLQQALMIRQQIGDRFGVGGTLNDIGVVYTYLSQYSKALEILQQALAIKREIGGKAGEAANLNNIAVVYSELGQYPKALDFYQQALAIAREIGDRRVEGALLNHIGSVYLNLGQYFKALGFSEQALAIKKEVGDKAGEGMTLDRIGAVYQSLGQYPKALGFFEQALVIEREIGDKAGEGNNLDNIGGIYYRLGQYPKALESFQQALAIEREIGDKAGVGTTLHNIGLVYKSLGQYSKALESYQQALAIQREIGDKAGVGTTLNNIGLVYQSLGQYPKALESYQQALAIEKEIGNKAGVGTTLSNIGEVYYSLGQYPKALESFQQALAIEKEIGDKAGEGLTLNNIGTVYLFSRQKQQALVYLTQALTLLQAVGDKATEAKVLSNVAYLDREQGNLNAARIQIETALKIVEQLRTLIVSQELRTSYFASVQGYYKFYIDLLMQLHKQQPLKGYNAMALQASESARARSLLELLNEAHADIRTDVDPKLLEQERTLQQQLDAKEKNRIQLLSGNSTASQAAALEKEISALLSQYQEVKRQLRVRSPHYAALKQPQPLTLAQMQQQVLDNNTLLLEYSLGQEHSYLWAVSKTSITSLELPRQTEVEAAAKRYREALTTPSQRTSRHQVALAAVPLSQMLLGPVAKQLGQKRLLIVSDGVLQYIPFAALPIPTTATASPTASPTPLLVEHEIVSLPSASTLAVLRQELNGRQPAPKTVAVFADPVFGTDDERLKPRLASAGKHPGNSGAIPSNTPLELQALQRSATESGVTFNRLPGTQQEAEQILKLVPAHTSIQAFGFAANLTQATNPKLAQYKIVHFATHSIINSLEPELSGIVLSLVDENGAPKNGFLRLPEIFNLNLPADLVVLSACETALGQDVKGEGLVGLTRGFMYAGTPRVVVSLWNVDDRATAVLMKKFYQGMLELGLKPAAALRAAQIEMWKQQQWQAPYYWAAFVLQGEWK